MAQSSSLLPVGGLDRMLVRGLDRLALCGLLYRDIVNDIVGDSMSYLERGVVEQWAGAILPKGFAILPKTMYLL
jgi:hypothetical protein